MQRSATTMPLRPTPTINMPHGSFIVNHGTPGQFTLYTGPTTNQPPQNGVPYVTSQHGQNRQMTPSYSTYGTYGAQEIVPTGSYPAYMYQSYQPHFIAPYAPTPAYSGGGQTYAYPGQPGYIGPPATDVSMPPVMATQPPQQGPPVVNIPATSSNVVGMANLPLPQSGDSYQQSLSQPPARQKNILAIVDPNTGKDRLEELLKEQQTHPQPSRFRTFGLWKPPPDQQQIQTQLSSNSALPTGASSTERRPSRSGSGTPRLDQPKATTNSGQASSRGQSPAIESSQNDGVLTEFLTQFSQRLGAPDETDLSAPIAEQLQPSADSLEMPPPATVPPIRTSPESSSFGQVARRTPPPTPPGISSSKQTYATKSVAVNVPVEFGVDLMPSTSSAVGKKPKDILGKQEIEFGSLNESTGDKSMDTADGEATEAAFVPQKQDVCAVVIQKGVLSEDGRNANVDTANYCSTPEKQQQPIPRPEATGSPVVDTQTEWKNDTAPKCTQDIAPSQESKSQGPIGYLAGQQNDDKVNELHSNIDAASDNNATVNASFADDQRADKQNSLEEGEIRDSSVVERSSLPLPAAAPVASENETFASKLTTEERTLTLTMLDELKKLETPGTVHSYSHEYMMIAAKLPASRKRPDFQTAKWSAENIDEVFNLNRQPAQQKVPESASRTRPMPPMAGGFNPGWMPGLTPMDMSRQKPYMYAGRLSDTSARGGKGGSRHGSGGAIVGGVGGGGGGISKQPPLVIARPSIEVELKTSKNAWKPSHKSEAVVDPEVAETKKLFKEVRGILNKITPQNFDELSVEFVNLEPRLNTDERVSGVIDIVFQKAVDEPSFCSVYCQLYDIMSKFQSAKQQQQPNVQQQDGTKPFRYILVSKCQTEFEKDKQGEMSRREREEAISKAETPEQKKQLQEDLEEFLQKEKRRTLGNMRFIGELFLRSMLTSKIMHRCIMELLRKTEDEESLECLCKLLTTIGKKLDYEREREKDELRGHTDGYYRRLEELAGGLSSRIRFMIMDLLELRKNSWQPRRKGEGPKTIEQLHFDAEKEKLEKQQELLLEERRKQEQTVRQDQPRKTNRHVDVPNRHSYGPPERQDRDFRPGKGDRVGAGRDRDQHQQGRQTGGRQGAGVGTSQPASHSSADSSKAKAPALSQHLAHADGEVMLAPKRWAHKKGPVASAAASASRPPEVVPTNRFEHLSKMDDILRGGSLPESRDSSPKRRDVENDVVNAEARSETAPPEEN